MVGKPVSTVTLSNNFLASATHETESVQESSKHPSPLFVKSPTSIKHPTPPKHLLVRGITV